MRSGNFLDMIPPVMVTPLGDYLAPPLIGAFLAANDQGTKSLESRQKEGLNSIARIRGHQKNQIIVA